MTLTPLRSIAVCGVLLSLAACAGGDLVDEGAAAPQFEQIFVSKNDISRSAVNLEVQAIEMRPGESVADALRRAGLEPASMGDVVEEARRAGPAAPESAAPESAAPDAEDAPPEGEPEPADPERPEPEAQPEGEPQPEPQPEGAPQPDAEPAPQPNPPPEAAPDRCSDSCIYAHDGACDDGRPGAPFAVCAPGTDCSDCEGAGANPAPQPDAPQPEPPAGQEDASPDVGGQICVANGRDGVCGPVAQCNGTPVAGFCPGPASVQCCLPGVAPAEPVEPEPPPGAQACHANGQDGSCISTGACGGVSVPGLCRGPADIQCCVDGESEAPAGNPGLPAEGQACLASGRPGVCQDIATCEGSSYPGHCAGDNSIKCCVPDALENKFLPLAYGAGLLIVRGVLFFATRSAAPVAGRAVVGVMRQSPGQTQVLMGASGTAIAAATASRIEDETQVLSGTAGAIAEGWRQGLAQSAPEAEVDDDEQAPAVPDTLPQTNLCAEQDGTSLDACVLRKRAEQGNATLDGVNGQNACGTSRHRELAANKDAICGQSSSCRRADLEVRNAAQNWISGVRLSAGQQLLLGQFCEHNRDQLANRVACIAARQQVVDECFPGELGNETHRCEICAQMAQRDACQTEQFVHMGCDTFLRALGM